MNINTEESNSIRNIVSPWDSLEDRVEKLAEKLSEILDTTQEKVHEILMISKDWKITKETVERAGYYFTLMQILESVQLWWHAYQFTLFSPLDLRKIHLENNYPEWTNRRDIILTGNQNDINAIFSSLYSIYYWDFS